MAQITLTPTAGQAASLSGSPYIVLDYTIANGSFTVNSITGYRSTYSNWDASTSHSIVVSVPGGSTTLYSKTGASWSNGIGYRSSGFTWDLSGGGDKTISCSGTGTITVTVSAESASKTGGTFTNSTNVTIPAAYTAPTVNSWSCSLIPTIIYLRSRVTHNITKNTKNITAENEINIDQDNTQELNQHYIYENRGSSYSGSDDLTATGDQLRDGHHGNGIGRTVYSNLEIWDDGGSYNDDSRHSSGWTVPSNLYSEPIMNSGKPTVKKIESDGITISNIGVANWIRNESSSYYAHALVTVNASSVGIQTLYYKCGHSAQNLGDVKLLIGSNQNNSAQGTDPNTETVTAHTGYNYNLSRGSSYYFCSEGIVKFLGVRKTKYSTRSDSIYIPYLPILTKNSFSYEWVTFNGYIAYHLVSANISLSNPNNEYIGNRYLSMNSNKRAISSISGNIWYTDNTNNHWDVNHAYYNTSINSTANAWMYYATDKYSESVVAPVLVQDNYSMPANKVNCALGNISIDLYGYFKAGNCVFNMPVNDKTKFPVGTMTATLQMSKSSDFSTITHQQTKTITDYGTLNNLFDGIELEGSDLGWNYIRIKWNLKSSSDYYNFVDVYSPVKTIEFTGIIPEIDEFTGYVDYATNKIKCKIKESTGIPKPKLYLEVYRISGGGVYQTFQVSNDTEFELPYDEPGTIWYIRAKAVNAVGTVYAVDENNKIIEKTYQIPYTTTEDYASKAKPKISAGKILYNQQCTMNFTWTNIVTNVDHVQYDIRMVSTNVPITPTDHTNKTAGYVYTFNNRIDEEKTYFILKVILLNSFNEPIVTYEIESNEITLDALDLGKQGFTYHTNTTYHSIEYVLDTFDKNTTAVGDDNKLVQMSVTLVDKETGQVVDKKFIGDENPTRYSLDLTPLNTYMFDDLLADHMYTLTIDTLCVNPLDFSKQHRVTETVDVSTKIFDVHPVKNIQTTITKQVDNKPTSNSNVQLKWDVPNTGDVDVTDYIVAYRKNSNPYTLVYTQNRNYTLASEIIPLLNDDEVYIRIGARYIDWFGNDVIKWIDLPVITAFTTNYIYYKCSYPNVEEKERFMYKIVDTGTAETLVRNVHINK